MTHPEVQMMIGRALTDRRFRQNLLEAPQRAAGEFSLSGEERDVIASIAAGSLEDFARQLNERLEASPEGGVSPNGHLFSRNGHGP